MRVLRQIDYAKTTWKNGGGMTFEAARVPAGSGAYRWRVSIAHIDASGPFSEFKGYRRHMTLLRGAGVDLSFADGSTASLRKVGDLIEFDGGLGAGCKLLEGSCVDLNLIVAAGIRARTCVVTLSRARSLVRPARETLLAMPIGAPMAVTAGGSPGEVAGAAGAVASADVAVPPLRLESWDLLVIEPIDAAQAAPSLQLTPIAAAAVPLVFCAALDDN